MDEHQLPSTLSIPFNFGIKLFEQREHGNITLVLKDADKLPANSIVLSANSPVFERLICQLGQTSILMDDFEGTAVRKFVESFYIGKLEDLERKDFSHFNKLCHSFQVAWLISRCRYYLFDILEALTETDFDDMMFLFDEVCFIHGTLNNSSLTFLIIKHIQHLDYGESVVVSRYAEKLGKLSKKELELTITLAGNNVSLLLRALKKKIEQDLVMDDTTKYVLKNVKLHIGKEQDSETFDEMFDILRNLNGLSMDDMKMVMILHSRAIQEYGKRMQKCVQLGLRRIPNLFQMERLTVVCQDAKDPMNLPKALRRMHVHADDMYILVSITYSLFCRYFHSSQTPYRHLKGAKRHAFVLQVMEKTLQEIVNIKDMRGWSKVSPDYLFTNSHRALLLYLSKGGEAAVGDLLQKFVKKVSECEDISSGTDSAKISGRAPKSLTLDEFLTTERKYKFYFKHPKIGACSEPGNCGFLLKVSPSLSGNSYNFNIELCTEPSDYATDIHFHDIISAEQMHFVIERFDSSTDTWYQISPAYPCKPAWSEEDMFWDSYSEELAEEPMTSHLQNIKLAVYYDIVSTATNGTLIAALLDNSPLVALSLPSASRPRPIPVESDYVMVSLPP